MPLFLLLSCLADLHSQTFAVKSDLLTGSLSSPNLSVEVKLSGRFTLEAGFHYNPFPAGGDKRWKHWFVQPELRYWMCQPFGGHFFGAHLMYGVYNVGGMKLPLGLFKGIRSSRYRATFWDWAYHTATISSFHPVGASRQASASDSCTPVMNVTVACIAGSRPVAVIKTSWLRPVPRYRWYT